MTNRNNLYITTVNRKIFAVKKFSPLHSMVKIKHAKYFQRVFNFHR